MNESIWHRDFTLEDLNTMAKGSMVEHIGIVFTEIGADYLVATMPVDARTKQPMGLLHGGASVTLAETMGSMGAWLAHPKSEEMLSVGLEINANHLKAVTSGTVTGKASPIRQGKTVQVWRIDISDESGDLICTSRITTMALKSR
ncbi:MAG: hotdog fold thioesterase [Saprospiraceae bacterium]